MKQPELNLEPNETLYVNKINDRVSLVELKESLLELFSQHGKVLDIVAKKNLKMRGQAFVVMESLEDAINA